MKDSIEWNGFGQDLFAHGYRVYYDFSCIHIGKFICIIGLVEIRASFIHTRSVLMRLFSKDSLNSLIVHCVKNKREFLA